MCELIKRIETQPQEIVQIIFKFFPQKELLCKKYRTKEYLLLNKGIKYHEKLCFIIDNTNYLLKNIPELIQRTKKPILRLSKNIKYKLAVYSLMNHIELNGSVNIYSNVYGDWNLCLSYYNLQFKSFYGGSRYEREINTPPCSTKTLVKILCLDRQIFNKLGFC